MVLDLRECVLESFHSYIQELPEDKRYGFYILLKNIGNAYEVLEIEEYAEDRLREIDRKPIDSLIKRMGEEKLGSQKPTLLQRIFG